MKALIGLIVILLIGVMGAVSVYNSLVTLQTSVEKQLSNIDSQIQRRADLVPNLENVAKGYLSHETDVFSEVTKAREKLLGAKTVSEKAEADGMLSASLGNFIAIAENYPDLKSDKIFVSLMDELSGTENRMAYARDSYNKAVSEFNSAIKRFPGVFFANLFGMEKAEFYKAETTNRDAPKVNFEKKQ